MNDPGVNVLTVQDIEYDKLLGPLPTVAHIMDTMVMIGLRCCEVRSALQQLKVAPEKNEMSVDQSSANLKLTGHGKYFHWLFYVQSARSESEQNLEVVTKHGQLFYRTTRDIKTGEELLVWYSKELVDAFQVPEVNELYDKDERRYMCHYCQESFVYPNPFKVHLMYRCHRRLAEVHGLNAVNKFQLDSINRLQLDLYSATMFHHPIKPSISNNNKINSGFTFSSLSNNFLDMYRRVTPMAAAAAAAAAVNNFGLEKENSSATTHTSQQQHGLASTNQALIPLFQSTDYGLVISGENSPLTASLKRGLEQAEGAVEVRKKAQKVHSSEKTLKIDECSLLDDRLRQPPSGSAFKKVSKTTSATKSGFDPYSTGQPSRGKQPLYPITSYSLPLASTGSPPVASMANLTSPSTPVSCWGGLTVTGSAPQERQTTPTPPPTNSTFSILNSVTSPYVTVSPRPNLNFNSSVSGCDDTAAMLTVSYRNAVFTDSMYQLSINLNGYGSNSTTKPLPMVASPPLHSPPQVTGQPSQQQQLPSHHHPPPPPPPPPPLASLLPPSLAALAFPSQNWCAKCNATFRMTSDLVYHMRSHHKRDPDPMKKKREDKLRCQICNESFRERHHLTRHMTSHN